MEITMTHHLISHHLCPYVQRSVIVLTEKGIAHKRTYIDLSDKPDWFLEVSPLGRVPVLQTGKTSIFESQVIVEYLDEVTEGSLHPADPLARARLRSWIAYASETLNAIGGVYSAPKENFEAKRQALKNMFAKVEGEVEGPYFAGKTFYMVDAAWGPVFRYLDVFDGIADFGLLEGLRKLPEWRKALAARETVQIAVPDGYPGRLFQFLKNRDSELGRMTRESAVPA